MASLSVLVPGITATTDTLTGATDTTVALTTDVAMIGTITDSMLALMMDGDSTDAVSKVEITTEVSAEAIPVAMKAAIAAVDANPGESQNESWPTAKLSAFFFTTEAQRSQRKQFLICPL